MARAKKVIENPIAYTIKDATFGEFHVLNSANAWWLDRLKVDNFIKACKIDASIRECCAFAGISIQQWRYFSESHPDFSRVKELCNELPNLKARNAIVNALDTDLATAKWYIGKKRKEEFGDAVDITTGGEKLGTFTNEQAELIARRILDRKPGQAASD